jgi:membrane-associated phospholipid phosphatase
MPDGGSGMIGEHRPASGARTGIPETTTPLWRLALVSIGVPVLLLGVIAGVSLLFAYLSVNMPPGILSIDSWLYRLLTNIRSPQTTPVLFILVNDPGLDYSLPIAVCLAFVWWRRRHDMVGAAAAVGLTMIVGAWSMPYTQHFGFRPRPFMNMTDIPIDPYWHEVWKNIPTFPSGHVREMTGLCVVLGYYWPRARWFAIAAAAFVAISRVHLGAHYPTDVLAGFVVGALAATFSLVTIKLAGQLLTALSKVPRLQLASAYLLNPKTLGRPAGGGLVNGVIRAGFGLALALLASYAVGYLVYIKEPRILADYLRNTDNSIVGPIFGLLTPKIGQVISLVFADMRFTYPLLLVILLWRSYRQKAALSRPVIAAVVAFATIWLLGILFGPSFERVRPLGREGISLPAGWGERWPDHLRFPDFYLAGLVTLVGILSGVWPAVRGWAYGYAMAAAVALLYCGAMWPMDALGNLFVGYWAAMYGRFVAGLLPPWLWWPRGR